MISKRLYHLFLLSVPMFIAHGMEEYYTRFYAGDPFSKFAFGPLAKMSNPQATFLLFQVLTWLLWMIFALMLYSEKWRMRLMILPGVIYIFEVHHVVHAFVIGHYYPGTATSLGFPIVGVFFWKEWYRCRTVAAQPK